MTDSRRKTHNRSKILTWREEKLSWELYDAELSTYFNNFNQLNTEEILQEKKKLDKEYSEYKNQYQTTGNPEATLEDLKKQERCLCQLIVINQILKRKGCSHIEGFDIEGRKTLFTDLYKLEILLANKLYEKLISLDEQLSVQDQLNIFRDMGTYYLFAEMLVGRVDCINSMQIHKEKNFHILSELARLSILFHYLNVDKEIMGVLCLLLITQSSMAEFMLLKEATEFKKKIEEYTVSFQSIKTKIFNFQENTTNKLWLQSVLSASLFNINRKEFNGLFEFCIQKYNSINKDNNIERKMFFDFARELHMLADYIKRQFKQLNFNFSPESVNAFQKILSDRELQRQQLDEKDVSSKEEEIKKTKVKKKKKKKKKQPENNFDLKENKKQIEVKTENPLSNMGVKGIKRNKEDYLSREENKREIEISEIERIHSQYDENIVLLNSNYGYLVDKQSLSLTHEDRTKKIKEMEKYFQYIEKLYRQHDFLQDDENSKKYNNSQKRMLKIKKIETLLYYANTAEQAMPGIRKLIHLLLDLPNKLPVLDIDRLKSNGGINLSSLYEKLNVISKLLEKKLPLIKNKFDQLSVNSQNHESLKEILEITLFATLKKFRLFEVLIECHRLVDSKPSEESEKARKIISNLATQLYNLVNAIGIVLPGEKFKFDKGCVQYFEENILVISILSKTEQTEVKLDKKEEVESDADKIKRLEAANENLMNQIDQHKASAAQLKLLVAAVTHENGVLTGQYSLLERHAKEEKRSKATILSQSINQQKQWADQRRKDQEILNRRAESEYLNHLLEKTKKQRNPSVNVGKQEQENKKNTSVEKNTPKVLAVTSARLFKNFKSELSSREKIATDVGIHKELYDGNKKLKRSTSFDSATQNQSSKKEFLLFGKADASSYVGEIKKLMKRKFNRN